MKLRSVILSLLAAGAVLSAGAQSKQQVRKVAPLDMKRVAEIEQMLEDTPRGFGVPYSNHKEWRRLRATGRFEKVIKDADKLAEIYSNLHQNIQDRFNAEGVEIMSPHYMAMRDGNDPAMPKDDLSGKGKQPE